MNYSGMNEYDSLSFKLSSRDKLDNSLIEKILETEPPNTSVSNAKETSSKGNRTYDRDKPELFSPETNSFRLTTDPHVESPSMKPNIPKPKWKKKAKRGSSWVSQRKSNDIFNRSQAWLRKKWSKIETATKAKEWKINDDCTFQPKISKVKNTIMKAYPSELTQSYFLQSGLANHYDRMNRARIYHQQKRQKKRARSRSKSRRKSSSQRGTCN